MVLKDLARRYGRYALYAKHSTCDSNQKIALHLVKNMPFSCINYKLLSVVLISPYSQMCIKL